MVRRGGSNPLHRRLPRELRAEAGKYLVIFLLMLLTIGMISGYLVAGNSMIEAYDKSFALYNIEDGHFETRKALNRAQHKAVAGLGIEVHELFFQDLPLVNGTTLRIYQKREAVNRECLMSGRFPEAPGEIAIDRMYAENNGLQPGDTLRAEGRSWQITGLVALSDYSALFSDNSDSMFDSLKFGVAVVCPEDFSSFDRDALRKVYAWKYLDAPIGEQAEHERAEELMKALAKELRLQDYVPRYVNQAITFAGDDLGGDKAMMLTLLYLVIAIMAFVFAVTISNTVTREAAVIGTLRASGYTRAELLRHYMSMPLLVTLISALLGNILGYTWFKDICAGLYYGSYSLTSYVTLWNAEAFLTTTLIPLGLMLCINSFVLLHRLKLPPLSFLRRDLSRNRQRRALPLSKRLPFFGRFRLRVILQNMSNYLVLFVGVLFANLLLIFGLSLPAVLDHYQDSITENLLSRQQYMLTIPLDALDEEHKLKSAVAMLRFADAVDTENPDAERFSIFTLKTTDERYMIEDVLLYGLETESRYVRIDGGEDAVWISAALAEKNELRTGDSLVLREPYGEETYAFTVSGVYPYGGAMCLFMERAALNRIMGEAEDYFCGYFSESPITDIDEDYLASVITLEDLTKVSRQLDRSMGGMMRLVDGFAVIIFAILIYLLAKIIIEKNAQAISMTKILGYSNREIARLYLLPTSIVVTLFLLLSLPIETAIMHRLFRLFMVKSIPGWIPFTVDWTLYAKMLALGLGAYALVAAIEYRRIRAVPMDAALKNVE